MHYPLESSFDHVSGHSTLGFKALVLMFTDSVSNVVVDFSLHREKGKKKDYGLSGKEQYSKERDAKSPDYVRWQEMDKSKIEVAIGNHATGVGIHGRKARGAKTQLTAIANASIFDRQLIYM